jgi:hypothetical protein
MATIQDHGETWAQMHEDWHITHQQFLAAASDEREAFALCAAGKGTGPSPQLVAQVEELRRAADAKRVAMDQFLRKVFGS